MRSWSQGDAPATCEISLVLTSVLWLKHRHFKVFTHFSWAILKVLPSGETRKMNLCGTQNSQFLGLWSLGPKNSRFSRENVPMTEISLPMGWIPWNFPYRLPKEFQATPKGLGFQTFTSHFFPANLHCFLPKLRCVPLTPHVFLPMHHHFPTIIISHPEKRTIYPCIYIYIFIYLSIYLFIYLFLFIYFSTFPSEIVFFSPLTLLFSSGPLRVSEARGSDTRRPADGSQGHDPGAPLAVPQKWRGLAWGFFTWKIHGNRWVCLKMGYIPNYYSHLIGIMISKTIGFRGTLFSDTPRWVTIT